MSIQDVITTVHRLVGSNKESRIDVTLPREGICGCALHEATTHGVQGALGCAALEHGSMPAIRMIYAKEPTQHCGAEPGVIALDRRCGRLAMSGVVLAAFAGPPYKPVAEYVKGNAKGLAFFGAGYCFQESIVPEARVRAARILGPVPFIIDLLRMVRVIGAGMMRTWRLVEVGVGVWHLEVVDKQLVPAWRFVKKLAEIVTDNPLATIGVDRSANHEDLMAVMKSMGLGYGEVIAGLGQMIPDAMQEGERMAFNTSLGMVGEGFFPLSKPMPTVCSTALVKWISERGWVIPDAAAGDLLLISSAVARQSVVFGGGRGRVKSWALIGDSVLRLVASLSSLSEQTNIEQCAASFRRADNSCLARIMDEVGLTNCLEDGATASNKVKGDAFEALVGVVVCHGGMQAAIDVLCGLVYPADRSSW